MIQQSEGGCNPYDQSIVQRNANDRPAIWDYYDRRVAQGVPGLANAVAYWSGLGIQASADDIAAEAEQLRLALRSLTPSPFVEVGTGPGTFTEMMPGFGIAIDQSQAALRTLSNRIPTIPVVRADALRLPLRDRSVHRAFAAHIYGLLDKVSAARLISEARRVADEVLILDAGCPKGVPAEHWQDRTLPDGSSWRIFRRHFQPGDLASEIGGSVLFGGRFYVLVAA